MRSLLTQNIQKLRFYTFILVKLEKLQYFRSLAHGQKGAYEPFGRRGAGTRKPDDKVFDPPGQYLCQAALHGLVLRGLKDFYNPRNKAGMGFQNSYKPLLGG